MFLAVTDLVRYGGSLVGYGGSLARYGGSLVRYGGSLLAAAGSLPGRCLPLPDARGCLKGRIKRVDRSTANLFFKAHPAGGGAAV